MKRTDLNGMVVWLDFSGPVLSCVPCAWNRQQLYSSTAYPTTESGVCQFCGTEVDGNVEVD